MSMPKTSRPGSVWALLIVGLWALAAPAAANELTFELVDNAKDCFYEEINKNKTVTFEYQVITGGQYDVDVELISPAKQVLYQQAKNQYDTFTFTSEITGVYSICFSNEFSTFSHKLVYMDLQIGDDNPQIDPLVQHTTALTQMELSATHIHKTVQQISDFQTHHRLREAQGRKRAEDINERVLWWSIIETFGIIVISVGQVLILRNFFTDKTTTTSSKGYARM